MTGHYTETAVSLNRSRTSGQRGSTSAGRSESAQRRALLLPQEFKELGADREVLILENCKPVLAEKLRYHREPVLMARLSEPPVVPRMDMELHRARSQQRWRYLSDDLPPGETVCVERLATPIDDLPISPVLTLAQSAAVTDDFLGRHVVPARAGGAIEPADDETTSEENSLEPTDA